MVLTATFNYISVISWQSVLLVEETEVPRENHKPVASHWQTLPHNAILSTPLKLINLRVCNIVNIRFHIYFHNEITTTKQTNKQTNKLQYYKTKYFPSRNHRSTYLFKSCLKAGNSLTKVFYFFFISGRLLIVVHFVNELITVIRLLRLVLQRL